MLGAVQGLAELVSAQDLELLSCPMSKGLTGVGFTRISWASRRATRLQRQGEGRDLSARTTNTAILENSDVATKTPTMRF